MDWLEDFSNRLVEVFDWSVPSSSRELEERLKRNPSRPEVPDVLWCYACGHLGPALSYDDDDSPWQKLRGELNHQGSVIPQTASTIPFALQLALHLPGAPQGDLVEDALWFGLGDQNFRLPWGCLELEQAPSHVEDPYFQHACYNALKRESKIIREIGSTSDTRTKATVVWTLGFLPCEAENVDFVRAQWSNEDVEVRRVALLSLAILGVKTTLEERQILEENLASPDEKLKLASALSLAIIQLRNEESPADIVLEELCSSELGYFERISELFTSGAHINSQELVFSLLDDWEELEPERVQAKRTPQY